MNFLRVPPQTDAPATMNADASLSFSRMRHQSCYVALGICGGKKNIRLQMEGTTSRGSDAARGQPAQSGKVGFRICCARIAHVAVPVIYGACENDWPRSRGAQLWKRMGPWAPRHLATRRYGNKGVAPPPNWDWAATALDISAPAPL